MAEPVAPPIGFADNPHAPDVFATAATGFVVVGGNIVITFESIRIDHTTSPGPATRVVIGRLVIPITGAQELALGLLDFMSKQGLDPVAAVKGSATKQ